MRICGIDLDVLYNSYIFILAAVKKNPIATVNATMII